RYFPNGSRITSWLPGIPRLLFPTAESVATSKILVGADPKGETRSRLIIEIAIERNADRPTAWPMVLLAQSRGTGPYLGDASTETKSGARPSSSLRAPAGPRGSVASAAPENWPPFDDASRKPALTRID